MFKPESLNMMAVLWSCPVGSQSMLKSFVPVPSSFCRNVFDFDFISVNQRPLMKIGTSRRQDAPGSTALSLRIRSLLCYSRACVKRETRESQLKDAIATAEALFSLGLREAQAIVSQLGDVSRSTFARGL